MIGVLVSGPALFPASSADSANDAATTWAEPRLGAAGLSSAPGAPHRLASQGLGHAARNGPPVGPADSRVVVIADGQAPVDPWYAVAADQAAVDVSRVWGGEPVRVTLRVVSRDEAALAGRAAATVTSDGGLPEIVVDARAMAALTLAGRRVVLTHEVVHVATRADTPAGFPLWLSEGFADYVAFTAAGVPVEKAAGQVLGSWRTPTAVAAAASTSAASTSRSGPAGANPGVTKFDPVPEPASFDGPRADLAYQAAYLTCRYLAQRFGQSTLVALYRGIGRGEDQSRGWSRMLADQLGVPYKQFTHDAAASASRLAKGSDMTASSSGAPGSGAVDLPGERP